MTGAGVAEWVLPGHPDRLADAVAEGIVDRAQTLDPQALCGVEVAVHRRAVFVTGRVAAGDGTALRRDGWLAELVADVYAAAGYRGRWALQPAVRTDLDLGPLTAEEAAIRRFSDDQAVLVGGAWPDERTGLLPPPAFAARRLGRALAATAREHPAVLGPDGKVLVWLQDDGDRLRWRLVNAAVQHAPEAGLEALHRLVVPALAEAAATEPLASLAGGWDDGLVRLNGAGEFSCGGPHGDNGLSGKKLVVDHLGPAIPIGGGALCGKDVHKVDRSGALRARQVAVRLAQVTGAPSTVTLVHATGLEGPWVAGALAGGRSLGEADVRRLVAVPDLRLEATARQLELVGVRWREQVLAGYFGTGAAWER